jgi:ligand-binding SRPBCC domain-containing protein
MLRGMFRSFEHDRFFKAASAATVMRDELRFSAPLGLLGLAAERLMLRRYFEAFLKERNQVIKHTAESSAEIWSRFIPTL